MPINELSNADPSIYHAVVRLRDLLKSIVILRDAERLSTVTEGLINDLNARIAAELSNPPKQL